LQYLESWLLGTGAVAIYNLMEDTATAEIPRSQVWQWVHQSKAALADGRQVSAALYRSILPEVLERIRSMVGEKEICRRKIRIGEATF
jgi:malate synthase